MPDTPAPIQGILFDKDGTLFDFAASWNAWAHDLTLHMADGNPARAAELAGAIGFDLATGAFRPDSFVIAGTLDDVVRALRPLVPGMDAAALTAFLAARAADAPMVPAADLPALLDDLAARGIAVGVATNDSEMPTREHLAQVGLSERFPFVVGADSGFGAKPDPGMCRAFAMQMGLVPGHVLMVGDSLHDLRAGRAAGMQTVAVLTGTATAADLAPEADAVLPDIGHLPDWLDRTGRAR